MQAEDRTSVTLNAFRCSREVRARVRGSSRPGRGNTTREDEFCTELHGSNELYRQPVQVTGARSRVGVNTNSNPFKANNGKDTTSRGRPALRGARGLNRLPPPPALSPSLWDCGQNVA